AEKFGAHLHVLHVLDNVFLRATVADPIAIEATAKRRLEDRLTDDDRRALGAEAVIVKSDAPADEIVTYAKTRAAELIVMGTHARAGVSDVLMGSVAERVVRTAPCPVLTVRHPEREFVVDAPVSA